MFRKVDHKNMGRANHGWLNTHFHFSFANYYNPNNMSFGALRVINDDLVADKLGLICIRTAIWKSFLTL